MIIRRRHAACNVSVATDIFEHFGFDVAAGDKIPRKNGPGITYSDILVINKTDLAPHVGASLEVMKQDSRMMRGSKPFLFTNCKTGEGIAALVELIEKEFLFDLKPQALRSA